MQFHVIVITVTATVIFFLAVCVKPIIDSYAQTNKLISIIVPILSTIGIYVFIAQALSAGLEKFEIFRQFVYGRSYLHGTWIGYFTGHKGDKRWMVEVFIQTLDDLRINGRSYDASGALHATWKVLATRIDPEDGAMTFAYEMNINKQPNPVRGVTTIQFDYNPKTGRPIKLSGLAQDLSDSVRIPIFEDKWKDTIESFDSALIEAQKRYPLN